MLSVLVHLFQFDKITVLMKIFLNDHLLYFGPFYIQNKILNIT
jgi:hypothetical protein